MPSVFNGKEDYFTFKLSGGEAKIYVRDKPRAEEKPDLQKAINQGTFEDVGEADMLDAGLCIKSELRQGNAYEGASRYSFMPSTWEPPGNMNRNIIRLRSPPSDGQLQRMTLPNEWEVWNMKDKRADRFLIQPMLIKRREGV